MHTFDKNGKHCIKDYPQEAPEVPNVVDRESTKFSTLELWEWQRWGEGRTTTAVTCLLFRTSTWEKVTTMVVVGVLFLTDTTKLVLIYINLEWILGNFKAKVEKVEKVGGFWWSLEIINKGNGFPAHKLFFLLHSFWIHSSSVSPYFHFFPSPWFLTPQTMISSTERKRKEKWGRKTVWGFIQYSWEFRHLQWFDVGSAWGFVFGQFPGGVSAGARPGDSLLTGSDHCCCSGGDEKIRTPQNRPSLTGESPGREWKERESLRGNKKFPS